MNVHQLPKKKPYSTHAPISVMPLCRRRGRRIQACGSRPADFGAGERPGAADRRQHAWQSDVSEQHVDRLATFDDGQCRLPPDPIMIAS